jgi:hypothetical protein
MGAGAAPPLATIQGHATHAYPALLFADTHARTHTRTHTHVLLLSVCGVGIGSLACACGPRAAGRLQLAGAPVLPLLKRLGGRSSYMEHCPPTPQPVRQAHSLPRAPAWCVCVHAHRCSVWSRRLTRAETSTLRACWARSITTCSRAVKASLSSLDVASSSRLPIHTHTHTMRSFMLELGAAAHRKGQGRPRSKQTYRLTRRLPNRKKKGHRSFRLRTVASA